MNSRAICFVSVFYSVIGAAVTISLKENPMKYQMFLLNHPHKFNANGNKCKNEIKRESQIDTKELLDDLKLIQKEEKYLIRDPLPCCVPGKFQTIVNIYEQVFVGNSSGIGLANANWATDSTLQKTAINVTWWQSGQNVSFIGEIVDYPNV